jgi:cytochrome c551/c552
MRSGRTAPAVAQRGSVCTTSSPGRFGVIAGLAGLAFALCPGAVAAAGTASAVPAWPAASNLRLLPPGASTAAHAQNARLDSVACTSAGNCVAVGSYSDATRSNQAMLATETDGAWGQASELEMPTGADTTAEDQHAKLSSVACTSPGNCVAVGSYSDAARNNQSMVAAETDGVWGQASEIAVPAGANASQTAGLDSVACTSPGNCVAAGSYTGTQGANGGASFDYNTVYDTEGMVATETDGVWAQASALALPTGAATGAGQQVSVASVTCTGPGSCVAVGTYVEGSGEDRSMIATDTSGVWGQASELVLPSNSPPAPVLAPAGLASVVCTGPGDCMAVGNYTERFGNSLGMAATETNGAWGPAKAVPMPPGAGGNFANLLSVACATPGNCVAVGTYEDVNVDTLAMDATETNGTWSRASELALPSARDDEEDPFATLTSVACTGPGSCVAVGSYEEGTTTRVQAMTLTSVPVASLALLTSATISSRHRTAKFAFAAEGDASGFQCALVRLARARHAPAPHYATCRASKRYTRLSAGAYVFYVRTTGPSSGRVPASRRFTIA